MAEFYSQAGATIEIPKIELDIENFHYHKLDELLIIKTNVYLFVFLFTLFFTLTKLTEFEMA